MKNNKKAFTLIELLVVIAIIGILATVSVIALQNARAKSRDAKRIADVKQVQTALELYFNDMNRYPLSAEFVNAISSTSSNSTTTYMARIPVAPTPADGNCSDSDNSFYYSSTDGSTYTLSFCIGGNTGSLTAGLNTLSPGGIAYGGPGSGDTGEASCSCVSGSLPCCQGCDPLHAVCQGGTYCANDSNCPMGQSCSTGGACVDFVCGNTVTINTLLGRTCTPSSDRCVYDTVKIGNQCWMKQNMNIGTMVTGATSQTNNSPTPILEKYCFGDNPDNCNNQGGLYQWDEAMQYEETERAQGICPAGWHIPTNDEQNTLDQYLTDTACDPNRSAWECANAGSKLSSYTLNGTNSSGFTGLLAGDRGTDGSFYVQGAVAYFWSSSMSGTDAWARILFSGYSTVLRRADSQAYGFSVRCLQN